MRRLDEGRICVISYANDEIEHASWVERCWFSAWLDGFWFDF